MKKLLHPRKKKSDNGERCGIKKNKKRENYIYIYIFRLPSSNPFFEILFSRRLEPMRNIYIYILRNFDDLNSKEDERSLVVLSFKISRKGLILKKMRNLIEKLKKHRDTRNFDDLIYVCVSIKIIETSTI